MKKILLIVMCAAMCACSQNKKNAQEDLFNEIHQDYVEMKKYHGDILKKDVKSVDIYIKKGEKITDVSVLSDSSHCVSVVFNNYERIYNIFFPKGEKILTWGKDGIKTSERAVNLNLIYE